MLAKPAITESASQSTDLEFNESVGQLKKLKLSAVELAGLLRQAAA